MGSYIRIIPIVALLCATAQGASAQATDSSERAPSCEHDSQVVGSFERCALRLERDRLMRGVAGVEVSHAHLLRPVALSHYVVGDSARYYALAYEHETQLRYLFRGLGSGIIVAGIAALIAARCYSTSCPPPRMRGPSRALVESGLAVTLVSVPFRIRARRASALALKWHNAALAR